MVATRCQFGSRLMLRLCVARVSPSQPQRRRKRSAIWRCAWWTWSVLPMRLAQRCTTRQRRRGQGGVNRCLSPGRRSCCGVDLTLRAGGVQGLGVSARLACCGSRVHGSCAYLRLMRTRYVVRCCAPGVTHTPLGQAPIGKGMAKVDIVAPGVIARAVVRSPCPGASRMPRFLLGGG